MNMKEVMLQRRSVRKFKKEKISAEIIQDLLECAMAAPSACNKKPWEFYIIQNEEKQKELANATRYGRYESPLIIIVAGNKERFISEKESAFWMQDCSAAIQNILLEATALGLGSCWCGIYPMETLTKDIREILNVGEEIIPLGLLHLGYPAIESVPRTQFEQNFVHYIK